MIDKCTFRKNKNTTLALPSRAMRSAHRTVRRLHEVNQSMQLTTNMKTNTLSLSFPKVCGMSQRIMRRKVSSAHPQKIEGQTTSEAAHKYELISSSLVDHE
jgi:hypothetical protein